MSVRAARPLLALSLLAACSDGTSGADAASDVVATLDALDARDGFVLDAPAPERSDVPAGEVALGGICSFNRDCAANARCACASGDCRCMEGERGTGVAGVTRCASGDDCESALCVDGNNGMLCSDGCSRNEDCPAALPRCITIGALSLSLCARDPNAPIGDGGTFSTALTATFGARSAPFDSARHGRQGSTGVYLEAYFRGDPACPESSSPTPDRTLVITGVRLGASGPQTSATGVRAVLLDFAGSLVSTPSAVARSVEVTPRELSAGTRVRLDLRATFDGGEVTGAIDAPWCRSLDDI